MLAAFEKEHRSQPLKVIGIERQGSSDGEIKTMAKNIMSAQQREIDQMKAWQKAWGYEQEE